MSTLPSRSHERSPARTVLLGYLLTQGAHDRVLQILSRVDAARLMHLVVQLSHHERALLAALMVRQPALELMARAPADVMALLYGGLDRETCLHVMQGSGTRAMALVWPFLTPQNQTGLVASNHAAAGRKPTGPTRGGIADAFRLRRLFRS